MRKPISETINGIEHHGEYEIKQGTTIDVYVYYNDKYKVKHDVDPPTTGAAEAYAVQLFFEMITGRYMGP